MTAPLHNPIRSSAIPASQNTAPVAEFRCLFTRDIRRKQKRWQDGHLKFHTFNSRVMVYDTSRNYLGDTYWKDRNEIQEGEELALDNGVLVEVADAVGVTETDLTPLLEKNKKPQQTNPAMRATPLPTPRAPMASGALAAASQRRHKSLNALLKTPRGPIGKALPIKSPYEVRMEAEKEKEKENECATDRAAKRRKTAQACVDVGKTSPVREQVIPKQHVSRLAPASGTRTAPTAQKPTRPAQAVIAIDSTPDNAPSDMLQSSPPRVQQSVPKPSKAARRLLKLREPADQPAVNTPKVYRQNPASRQKPAETPRPPPRSSSPPVSASNRLSNVEFALQPAQHSKESNRERLVLSSPTEEPNVSYLRLSTGPRRKKLMCESLSAKRARSVSDSAGAPKQRVTKPKKIGKGKDNSKRATRESDIVDQEAMSYVFSEDEMLDQPLPEPEPQGATGRPVIGRRQKGKVMESNSTGAKEVLDDSSRHSPPAFEDIDFIHGMMDQQMLPQALPRRATDSKRPPTAAAASRSTNRETISRPSPAKTKHSTTSRQGQSVPRRAHQEVPASRKSVRNPFIEEDIPMSITIPDSPTPDRSLPSSPNLSGPASNAHPRTCNPSPSKHQPTKKGAVDAVSTRAAGPDNIPSIPHPDTNVNQAPVTNATTTPAEPDRTHKPRLSASKQLLRRIKSLNDAPQPPIPSTATDWERKNLPGPDAGSSDAATIAHNATSDNDNDTNAANTAAAAPGVGPVAMDGDGNGRPGSKRSSGSGLAALIQKTDPQRQRAAAARAEREREQDQGKGLRRAVSLDTTATTTAAKAKAKEAENGPQSPTNDVDANADTGPWSSEAFDLFGYWRPKAKGKDKGRTTS